MRIFFNAQNKFSGKKAFFGRFLADNRGAAAIRVALLFGAAAIGMALVLTPQVQNAVEVYAESKALGVDPVTTASTKAEQSQPKTYTIRKSVLDE